MIQQETICAIASASGAGAIAIIRLSGKESFSTLNRIFYTSETWQEKDFKRILLFGNILAENEMIDEVLVGVFKSPHSFTGEDSVEIYCHGSRFLNH